MISLAEVAKLAELARVEVAPKEQEKLRQDLSKILDYVSELKVASTGADSALTRTAPGKVRPESAPVSAPVNIWREDLPRPQTDDSGNSQMGEKLLAAAPERSGDYFKVKKILG